MASRQTVSPLRALAAIPLTLLTATLLTPLACARHATRPVPVAVAPESDDPAAHAAEPLRVLEQAIEADRTRLVALIAERTDESPALRENPELLAIAERLPRLEEELRLMKRARQPAAAETNAR